MKFLNKASMLAILLLTLLGISKNATCMDTWGRNNYSSNQESEEKKFYEELMEAIGITRVDNVEALLALADPNFAPYNKITPLALSLYYLINPEPNNNTVNNNNISILKLLLKANVSNIVFSDEGIVGINPAHKATIPALYVASAMGFSNVVEHLLKENYELDRQYLENVKNSLINHNANPNEHWTLINLHNKFLRRIIPQRTEPIKKEYKKIYDLLARYKKNKETETREQEEKIVTWHKQLQRKEITVDQLLIQEYEKLLTITDDKQSTIQNKVIENILSYFVRTETKLDDLLKKVINSMSQLNNLDASLKIIIQLRKAGAQLPSDLNVQRIATESTQDIHDLATKNFYTTAIENLLAHDLSTVSIIEDANFLTAENPDHNDCCICIDSCYKDTITHNEKKLGFAIIKSFKCGCKNMWYGNNCLNTLARTAPSEYVDSPDGQTDYWGHTQEISCKILRCPTCKKGFNLDFNEAYIEGKAFWCPKIEHKNINELLEEENEEEIVNQEIDVKSEQLKALKNYFSPHMIEKIKFIYQSSQEDELSEIDSKLLEVENKMKNIDAILNQNIEKHLPAAIAKIEAKIKSEKDRGNIDDSNTIKAILLSLTINENHLEIINYAKNLDS